MKKNYSHTILSVVISILILLPFAIQTWHALEAHEHTVCTAKDVKHFHKQEVDCTIYHQIIEYNSIDFPTEFDLEITSYFKHSYTYFYQDKYYANLQLKSSRAPPYFIV